MNAPTPDSELMPNKEFPELIIGLMGPVGTDTMNVSKVLEAALRVVDFIPEPIHLIEYVQAFKRWSRLSESPYHTRLNELMTAGDEFREALRMGNAFACVGISRIKELRFKETQKDDVPRSRTAYILRSLKTPEEVRCLRAVYGRSFLLFAAYSGKDIRRGMLAKRIADSCLSTKPNEYDSEADKLINRDEAEPERTFGQNIREAFPLADFFVNTDTNLDEQIKRIVELVFGNNHHTPTKDEYGMCHAWTASMRSASLSRQVGSAIVSGDGEMISVGCNEVPKAGGGQYWSGDVGDARDIKRGADRNDEMKRALYGDLLDRLKKRKWLAQDKSSMDAPALLDAALTDLDKSGLGRAELLNISEYSRLVHAEMAALMQAALRGVSVDGCTLFTTTFPCHNCAKHLIAAGIMRVVYIEPYPKSYAGEFHNDSIEIDGQWKRNHTKPVRFEPFVGVAPRCYLELFSIGETPRKIAGKVNEWIPRGAIPRVKESPLAYMYQEDLLMEQFKEELKRAGLDLSESRKQERI